MSFIDHKNRKVPDLKNYDFIKKIPFQYFPSPCHTFRQDNFSPDRINLPNLFDTGLIPTLLVLKKKYGKEYINIMHGRLMFYFLRNADSDFIIYSKMMNDI